jgi:hypothetical protein
MTANRFNLDQFAKTANRIADKNYWGCWKSIDAAAAELTKAHPDQAEQIEVSRLIFVGSPSLLCGA